MPKTYRIHIEEVDPGSNCGLIDNMNNIADFARSTSSAIARSNVIPLRMTTKMDQDEMMFTVIKLLKSYRLGLITGQTKSDLETIIDGIT